MHTCTCIHVRIYDIYVCILTCIKFLSYKTKHPRHLPPRQTYQRCRLVSSFSDTAAGNGHSHPAIHRPLMTARRSSIVSASADYHHPYYTSAAAAAAEATPTRGQQMPSCGQFAVKPR